MIVESICVELNIENSINISSNNVQTNLSDSKDICDRKNISILEHDLKYKNDELGYENRSSFKNRDDFVVQNNVEAEATFPVINENKYLQSNEVATSTPKQRGKFLRPCPEIDLILLFQT